jgi:hypothetical protein
VRLGAFPHAQSLPSIAPTLTPNAYLDPVEADLKGDFFVQYPAETQQDDHRPLGKALADCARPAEFLQQFLLSFTNYDFSGGPCHWSVSSKSRDRARYGISDIRERLISRCGTSMITFLCSSS